jgi:hypothetical protein
MAENEMIEPWPFNWCPPVAGREGPNYALPWVGQLLQHSAPNFEALAEAVQKGEFAMTELMRALDTSEELSGMGRLAL